MMVATSIRPASREYWIRTPRKVSSKAERGHGWSERAPRRSQL